MQYPEEYKDLFQKVAFYDGDGMEINISDNSFDDSTKELMEFCREIKEDIQEEQTVFFT